MPLYTPSTLYPSYTSESHTVSLVLSTQRVSQNVPSPSHHTVTRAGTRTGLSTPPVLILQEIELEYGGTAQSSLCKDFR